MSCKAKTGSESQLPNVVPFYRDYTSFSSTFKDVVNNTAYANIILLSKNILIWIDMLHTFCHWNFIEMKNKLAKEINTFKYIFLVLYIFGMKTGILHKSNRWLQKTLLFFLISFKRSQKDARVQTFDFPALFVIQIIGKSVPINNEMKMENHGTFVNMLLFAQIDWNPKQSISSFYCLASNA